MAVEGQAARGGGRRELAVCALEKDITKVLGTVLIGVTFCMIFGTALATDVVVSLFGGRRRLRHRRDHPRHPLRRDLPQVDRRPAEKLARFTLPMINAFTFLLTPLSG